MVRGKVAEFCEPDAVKSMPQLPHTATAKLLKTKLRKDFAGVRWLRLQPVVVGKQPDYVALPAQL